MFSTASDIIFFIAFVLQKPDILNSIQHSQIQDLQEENIRQTSKIM